MRRPPEEEEDDGLKLPAIQGVIIIPGNIAFLNQFFSVILQASNTAPDGSGLDSITRAPRLRCPPVGTRSSAAAMIHCASHGR